MLWLLLYGWPGLGDSGESGGGGGVKKEGKRGEGSGGEC